MAKVNPNRWTKQEIAEKIRTSDIWAYRALKRLFTFQTDREQNDGLTKERNDMGFNAVDSVSLTKLAKSLNARGWLSVEELRFARKLLTKYSGQLARIAKDKPFGLQ